MSPAGDDGSLATRPLGGSGIDISVLGVGCNNFGARLDHDGADAVVSQGLELGVTFFDTADAYGGGESERFLGRSLRGRRGDVVIATKFGWGEGPGDGAAHGTRDAVRASVDGSLERLGTDSIDLYYYHRPDGITPIGETVAAMGELVEEGIVRAVGCSNVSLEQLREAHATHPVAAVQNEYSLLRRKADEVVRFCADNGIGFVPYRPLAQGLLTGKYAPGAAPPKGSRLESRPEAFTPEELEQVGRLAARAETWGYSLLEVGIAWLVRHPAVSSVIAGAMTPEQVSANVAAARRTLGDREYDELTQPV